MACLQAVKLQEKVVALESVSTRTAKTVHGPWMVVLSIAAVAARAAAAASGALAVLYCAMTVTGIRSALYTALAAQPGALSLSVLAVLGLATFTTASISREADRWVASIA